MTARDDLLVAATRITRLGSAPFRTAELVAECRRGGSTYADGTLRTMLQAHLCADAGTPEAASAAFVRVSRGKFVLNPALMSPAAPNGRLSRKEQRQASSASTAPTAAETGAPQATRPSASPLAPTEEWSWEGNVQAAVVRLLAGDRWDIVRVADTASRQHGHDIVAAKAGMEMLVEVKGFPSTRYVRGPKAGQPKPTSPNLQARHWYANALLSGVLMRSEHPNARVVLAFPRFTTYENLARRTAGTLRANGIEIWLVDEVGRAEAV